MSALPKVDVNGQIPVPVEVQQAADIHVGDEIGFHVIGPGHFEVFKRDKYQEPARVAHDSRETIEPDEVQDWRKLQLPKVPLRELIARYRSDLPYDDAAIREAWQAAEGDELADRIRRGLE
jgi:bifunctional DNA-binding transcriptional regulator/antitoxin component of YhaV-PrlF toxin-antitoxin module